MRRFGSERCDAKQQACHGSQDHDPGPYSETEFKVEAVGHGHFGYDEVRRWFIYIRTKLAGNRNQPERVFPSLVNSDVQRAVENGIIAERISVGR